MYLFAAHYKDLAKVEHYNDRPVDHHFGRLYHFTSRRTTRTKTASTSSSATSGRA